MSPLRSLQSGESSRRMAYWSDLPSELLITIAGLLPELRDLIRFRCICLHWRSALPPFSFPQLPWLLLPSTSRSTGHFYSLYEDHIYPLPLPVSKNTCVYGSSSGWLLALKGQKRFSIMNPFTGDSIVLPCPESESPLFGMTPDTIVWDHSDSTVVVGNLGRRGCVFYCHLGEGIRCWKHVKSMQNVAANSITFYDSKFYIHDLLAKEMIILEGETPKVILVLGPPIFARGEKLHLVGSSGESLLFLCCRGWPNYGYVIYERNKFGSWRSIEDIGDRVIFLDYTRCFSVDIDERSNLKRNLQIQDTIEERGLVCNV